MRCLNHANVIGTVAYRKEEGLLVLLDELHDQGLLQRRDTTCDK